MKTHFGSSCCNAERCMPSVCFLCSISLSGAGGSALGLGCALAAVVSAAALGAWVGCVVAGATLPHSGSKRWGPPRSGPSRWAGVAGACFAALGGLWSPSCKLCKCSRVRRDCSAVIIVLRISLFMMSSAWPCDSLLILAMRRPWSTWRWCCVQREAFTTPMLCFTLMVEVHSLWQTACTIFIIAFPSSLDFFTAPSERHESVTSTPRLSDGPCVGASEPDAETGLSPIASSCPATAMRNIDPGGRSDPLAKSASTPEKGAPSTSALGKAW
mmetsp:Transcript_3315/g.9395  ORF Transcript_3315/g.9395 Transcript_3315/m.9395 type:complete len:271 (+) Transcript_3315:918-1730(+)